MGLTVKQAEFLAYEGREALYGGAAGGGKSVALLAAALQYMDEPGYTALILRRTYKQLAKSDSILAKSKEWLWGRAGTTGEKVKWNGEDHKWTFPNGNTLEFGHMQHADSMLDYQGGAWAFVGVDECTQFTGEMLAYPRTRQRRPAGSQIPIRWRGGSNPGGVGHEYVKLRYVKDREGNNPSTPQRQFFPARIEDNPNIDRVTYIETLQEAGIAGYLLEQLLKGDWDAVPGGRFKREWFRRWERAYGPGEYRLHRPNGEIKFIGNGKFKLVFQTCDPAASEKTTADYTVISTWGITDDHDLAWLDCFRFQKDIPDIPPLVEATYKRWQPAYIAIEAVAANNAVAKMCSRLPIVVKTVGTLGLDKLNRATPAMVFTSEGRLYLPFAAPWLEDVESELIRFTGDEDLDAHDDVVDTLSIAAAALQGRLFASQGKASLPFVHQR